MSERLDIVMVKLGLAGSRERAKELIKNSSVTVNGTAASKPSQQVSCSDSIEITGQTLKYVGRGGLKLEKIISGYGINLTDRICMDIGASTGGFTDCMLQNGASKVYAVDVGSGQLAQKLVMDGRVINMEKTDIRKLSSSDFDMLPDFISIDVSFISLKLVLPKAFELLAENGRIAALIKPQFEAGKQNVGKNGIVKSKAVHAAVLSDICGFIRGGGLGIEALCYSPVTGSKGNIEYLVLISPEPDSDKAVDLKLTVQQAFLNFRSGGVR